MTNQLTARQAAALLAYLENRFSALMEHYERRGFKEDRADNALDELCGLRDSENGSGLSPVDATLILSFITEMNEFDNAPAIAQLNEIKKQRQRGLAQ
ncbi:hypothetical protein [Aeromonas phage 32]|nr:hypothetical protein [Aeromonas phage 32]